MGILSDLPSPSSIPQDVLPVKTATNVSEGFPNPKTTVTNIPAGIVLFEDDFEKGVSKWNVGQGWDLRTSEKGNHFYCVRTNNSDYSYTSAGSTIWKDYALEVKVMVLQSSNIGSVNIMVRSSGGNSYSDYNYDFSEQWADLTKEVGPPYARKNFDSMIPRSAIGEWQIIRFEAKGTYLAIFLDGELVLQAEDASLDHGAITLGAGGTGMDVCFDDVKVRAIGE